MPGNSRETIDEETGYGKVEEEMSFSKRKKTGVELALSDWLPHNLDTDFFHLCKSVIGSAFF